MKKIYDFSILNKNTADANAANINLNEIAIQAINWSLT